MPSRKIRDMLWRSMINVYLSIRTVNDSSYLLWKKMFASQIYASEIAKGECWSCGENIFSQILISLSVCVCQNNIQCINLCSQQKFYPLVDSGYSAQQCSCNSFFSFHFEAQKARTFWPQNTNISREWDSLEFKEVRLEDLQEWGSAWDFVQM